MTAERVVIDDVGRGVVLEVQVAGAGGEVVVLLPSAMRSGDDFALLQAALSDAGYRSLALNPRGVGRSTLSTSGATLRDIADDVAFVVDSLAGGPVHFVGHAFGNVVVRATASYHPDIALTVTVAPCGGHNLGAHPVREEVLAAFPRCHDRSLTSEERLEALQIAFFASGNDARTWLEGWWPTSDLGGLTMRTNPDEWWRAGTAPILIMHPLEDAMSPMEAGRESAAAFGRRATYVEVPRCGHAFLPEQPEVIATNLISFLRAHPGG